MCPVAITLVSIDHESCCTCDLAESRSPWPLSSVHWLDSGLRDNERDQFPFINRLTRALIVSILILSTKMTLTPVMLWRSLS